MPEAMPFAATVIDQSNTVGFQFDFRCLRCGTAYSSHFHALSSLAADAGGTVLKKAGGLLGSRAGKVFEAVGDYVGDRAADVVKEQAKDRAFQAAVQEVAPQFIVCPSCHRWMCRPMCFNSAAGLCQDCASQAGQARPPVSPVSLEGSVPPPVNAAPPPPMSAGYALPPGQTSDAGYALPSPPPAAAALPPHPGNPGYASPSRARASRHAPPPSLQVHIRASRHHPGTVSLVIVDADDRVIAALHLRPDEAEDLADDLLSAAQTAMRRLEARH
jgi:hypothetical protein